MDHALVKSLQDEVRRPQQWWHRRALTPTPADPTSEALVPAASMARAVVPVPVDDGQGEMRQHRRERDDLRHSNRRSTAAEGPNDQKQQAEEAASNVAEKAAMGGSGGVKTEAGGMTAAQVRSAGAVLQSIFTREVETWKQMDKMKRVLEKFFRFELEEEVLKAKLDKFMGALAKLQEQSLSTIDQVQAGQMNGAPLHPLLASRGASISTETDDSAPAKQQQQQQHDKKQPLFKKSDKPKAPISGAGAAAAMSAMEAFSSPGGGVDDDDEPTALNIDTDTGNPTPVLSVESVRTSGSLSAGKPQTKRAPAPAAAAAAPAGGPRQPNVPLSMQLGMPQEDGVHSSSFLTAVDTGLPSIRSSADSSSALQPHPHNRHNQQQQQQQQAVRTSADFGGVKKPSPKHSQQQQQQQLPVGGRAGLGKQRRGSGGGSKALGQAPRSEPAHTRVPVPPQQQQPQQPQVQMQVRQMNVPVSMQQQLQSNAKPGLNNPAGNPNKALPRQSSQKSLGREGSRVRLEAADIIEDIGTSEEEEEAMLRKELAKAQKKLKKQQQLQEWLREKENRAMAVQAQEEEAKQLQEQEEAMKERKRKDYARKQKERLQGYKSKISQEAQKIQELVDLGISPESLF